jgi:flagellar biosynthetic protein FlhB
VGDEDKQFEASQQKLQKAKEDGQVVKSKDISTAVFLMVMFGLTYAIGPMIWEYIGRLIILMFEQIPNRSLDRIGHTYILTQVVITLVVTLVPFFFVALLTAIAGDFFQVGPLVSTKALEPKFDKLNPVKGIKNLFTMRSLIELVKNIIKIVLMGYIGYLVFKAHLHELITIGATENVMVILGLLSKVLFEFMVKAGVLFLALGLGDYLFQRWKFMQDQKMSFKELKDEYKNSEGDPHVKAALRQKRMQMLQQRMLEAVPEADVIVTNPIHIAVAIQYSDDVMAAPHVIAKGTELFAEKIKEIANSHGVPIVENQAVAQTLYKLVEIDQEIPPDMYQTVAEILMFAWRVKGQTIPGRRKPSEIKE